ncbi:MAG: hypothetical protein R3F30_03770 [Planctomycetota bacterium]
MSPRLCALLVPVLLLPACGGPAAAAERDALACLASFRKALAAGDRAALRGLLTAESRRACDQLPRRSDDCGYEVLSTRSLSPSEVRVRLRDGDPEASDREGVYVVVREDGRWVVDLVATAGLNKVERALPGPATRVVPADIDPAVLRRQAEAALRRQRR